MAKGISDLITDLDTIVSNFEEAQNQTIMKLLSDATLEVKNRTPVGETGDLKGDWHIDINGSSGDLLNTMDYAAYVEYGHKTRGGKSFVPGVFMLKDTYELMNSHLDDYVKYFWSRASGRG